MSYCSTGVMQHVMEVCCHVLVHHHETFLAPRCAGPDELVGVCVAGDDDEDELVPLKLKETKRFRDREVIAMEIGGQMAFILSRPKAEAVKSVEAGSAAQGSGSAAPEPAPADAIPA